MTPKKPDTTGHHVAADKWTAMREKERITRVSLPHLNSTMRDLYEPRELDYRGKS